MSTIADLWKAHLTGEGYTFSSVQDTIRQALLSETGRSTGNIQELWKAYLVAEGYDGAVPDMMKKWLVDKGYDGTVQDMLKKALRDGDIFWTPNDLFSGGEFGDWIDWRDNSRLFKNTLATDPVTASGDLIAAAVGARGNVILTQATSGSRGKWAEAEGISSELISAVTMQGSFTIRAYPTTLTVAHVTRRANLDGSGDLSDMRVRDATSLGTMAGRASGALNAARSRGGAALGTGANEDILFHLFAMKSSAVNGTFKKANGTAIEVSNTIATGDDTQYDNFYLDQRRSLSRFAYSTLSLFIERDLTDAELIQLAAYAGA